MELRQLAHFVAAVEHGNIVRAASAVHLSQPALSKSIQKLEATLGVPLLVRTPRGVSATPYGEILLRYARLMRTQGERATAEIAAVKAGRRGHLTLGVGMSFIGYLLPGVVAELLGAHPGLSLAVVDGSYDTLVARLRHGELDAVLSAFPPVPREEGLVYEELLANPMVYVTRADHPLVRRRSVALATLAQERWVMVSRPAVLRELLNTAFEREGAPPPVVPLIATSMHFLRAVLCEGRFVSFLPRDIVEEDLRAGRLAVVPVAERPRSARSGLIRRAEGIRPPALDLLVAALVHRRDALQPAKNAGRGAKSPLT